jgi:hypothetical protein
LSIATDQLSLDSIRHQNVIDPVTFAGLIGKSEHAVYRMIRNGEMPVRVIKLGARRYAIPVSDVVRLFEGE